MVRFNLPACQCLSGQHSRQYGYNHCSEKMASLGVRLMAGRQQQKVFLSSGRFMATNSSATKISQRAEVEPQRKPDLTFN